MSTKLIKLFCCCLTFVFASCGGGGGSAGQQSVLKVVNSTSDAEQLDVSIDGEPFFSSINAGQASAFREVLAGDRLVFISESAGAQRTLELQNEFAFGIPYTIVVAESNSKLLPIVVLNDRSDTPPAQFRVRAINASTRAASVRVKLVPGVVGRASIARKNNVVTLLRATTATPQASSEDNSIVSATPTSPATPTSASTVAPTASPQASPTQSSPSLANATPTAVSTAQVSATATAVSTNTPQQISIVTVAQNLNFQQQSDYILVPQSDYRIEIEANGTSPAPSGVITFSGGQVLTILIRDQAASEGNGTSIMILDDKP